MTYEVEASAFLELSLPGKKHQKSLRYIVTEENLGFSIVLMREKYFKLKHMFNCIHAS